MIETLELKILEELTPIKITEHAFEKSNYIAKRIIELAKTPLEIGWYFSDNPVKVGERPNIVLRDAYIGYNQLVEPDFCEIKGKRRNFKEIVVENNEIIVGWGHSHANMGTFYSGTDVGNIRNRVKQWGKYTNIIADVNISNDSIIEPKIIDGKNGFELIVGDNEYKIHSKFFDEHKLEILKKYGYEITTPKEFDIGFFYGMTFNAKGSEPHCVIVYKNKKEIKVKEYIGYEIVNDDKKRIIDKNQIDKHIILETDKVRRLYQYKMNNDLEREKNQFISTLEKAYKVLEKIDSKKDDEDYFSSNNKSIKLLNEKIKLIKSIRDKYQNTNLDLAENLKEGSSEDIKYITDRLNDFMDKFPIKKFKEKEKIVYKIIKEKYDNELIPTYGTEKIIKEYHKNTKQLIDLIE